jgi:DNA-binding response OmpR family regulator
MAPLILLVEADEQLRHSLSRALDDEGVSVQQADSAIAALELLESHPFHLVVLDLDLPDVESIGLIERARADGITLPIMLMCDRSDDRRIARALDAGADEYVVKPVSPVALAARVRALARRATPPKGSKHSADGLELDERQHSASGELGTVKLTTKELMLLRLLIGPPRRVWTRAELLAEVWGYDFDPHTTVLDVAVHRVRGKVRQVTHKFEIESRRGAGFELVAAEPAREANVEEIGEKFRQPATRRPRKDRGTGEG